MRNPVFVCALLLLLGPAPAARAAVPLVAPAGIAWHEPTRGWYVSNSGPLPDGSGRGGWIARLDARDRKAEPYWMKGLDRPRGLAALDKEIFVADGDSVVIIDIETRAVRSRLKVPGARMLHGVAADALGNVYLSDILGDTIFRLPPGGRPAVFVKSRQLQGPTGLAVKDAELMVATWGKISDARRLTTRTPGRLFRVALGSKEVAAIGVGTVGNLDGLVVDNGTYVVTDPVAGTVLRLSGDGKATLFRGGLKGPAGIASNPRQGVLAVTERDRNNVLFLSLR